MEFGIGKWFEIFSAVLASNSVSAFHDVECFAFTKDTRKILSMF